MKQSYWDFMKDGKTPKERRTYTTCGVYVAGSLRNPGIPSVAQELNERTGHSVFCDWFAAGPEADDHWKAFYRELGFSYREALKEPASVNTFEFDKKHMDNSRAMVLVLPAGKSGHLELGYFIGCGKPGYILLDGNDDRWDVMYQYAAGVTSDIDELSDWIRKELK